MIPCDSELNKNGFVFIYCSTTDEMVSLYLVVCEAKVQKTNCYKYNKLKIKKRLLAICSKINSSFSL